MRPILTRSEITGAVYIATRYRILEDGSVDATEKYDATDQFDAMTEPMRAENAKLRHALKNSVNCRKFGGCFVCPQFHEHAQYDAMCDNDMLMKELGIEVE